VGTSPRFDIIGHGEARPSLLLLRDPHGPDRFVPRANSPWLRFLAPESKPLLAARAERLVSPPVRMALAQDWRELLKRAVRPAMGPRPSQVPLCRDRIVAAEGDVAAMLGALTAPRPISAQGVALASCLLCDGSGPLYDRHSRTDLRTALRAATSQLQSWGETV
jgi:hypothetical protein